MSAFWKVEMRYSSKTKTTKKKNSSLQQRGTGCQANKTNEAPQKAWPAVLWHPLREGLPPMAKGRNRSQGSKSQAESTKGVEELLILHSRNPCDLLRQYWRGAAQKQ